MGILWFGVDDAATSCLTPIYCCTQGVPECLSEGNGSMLEYSPTSAFWLFNRVSNFAYMRYDMIAGDIRKVVDKWENEALRLVRDVDAEAMTLSPKAAANSSRSSASPRRSSCSTAGRSSTSTCW